MYVYFCLQAESMMSKGPTPSFTHLQQPPSQSPSPVSASPSPATSQAQSATSLPQTIAMTTYSYSTPTTSANQKPTNISMQLPTGGIATLVPSSNEGNQSFLNYMQGNHKDLYLYVSLKYNQCWQPVTGRNYGYFVH